MLDRVTFNKDLLCGKPTIRGMRISVEMIIELLSVGETEQNILEDYPELEPDDIRAVLAYAHRLIAGESIYQSNSSHEIL